MPCKPCAVSAPGPSWRSPTSAPCWQTSTRNFDWRHFRRSRGLGVDPRPSLKKALSHPDPAIRIPIASLMVQLKVEVDLAEPVLLQG